MERTIENGITVINTGVNTIQKQNKYGIRGIVKVGKKYIVAFQHKGKKYQVGTFDTVEDAAAISKFVQTKIQDGTIFDFLKERPVTRSKERKEFFDKIIKEHR